ncbi:MAG: lipid A deacylase LpxR family protein [Pseudomonadota bacterium]|mgnify:CR=1 FL=1
MRNTWMSRSIGIAVAVIAGLGQAPPVIAQSTGQTAKSNIRPDANNGTLRFTFENDIFGGTDEGYTNGVRFDYVTPTNQLPWLARKARESLLWMAEDGADWYATFSLGQNIYTPQDLLRRTPDPNDRPYGGFTYASVGLAADSGYRLDTLALDFGVVGRMAQADDVQRAVHDLIDADDPLGWDSQLRNEPAIRLVFERKYRFGYDFDLDFLDLQADAAPHFGLALGNVDTSGAAGFTFRFGDRLDDTFGPPRIRPAVASPGFYEPVDGIGWYVFSGIEARAVARNIFLDGNTFRDSPNVEPHRLVGDLSLGFALQYQDVELSYTHVLRTPEFRGQRGFAQFGSVSISTRF